jgi:hypothetical protein
MQRVWPSSNPWNSLISHISGCELFFFIRPAQPVNATFGGEMNQTAGTLV